jgi:hypothetical protein
MYDRIKPYLGNRIVELGAGRGNLSRFLRRHGHFLATDYRADYLTELQDHWGYSDSFQVAALDLTQPRDFEVLRGFAPDTVVCMNVLEHIQDDQAVLTHLYQVLPDRTRLVFLVPFDPKLISEFDRQIGHVRRYQAGELEDKMARAGFSVERQFYFNKAGVCAWWFGNRLCHQRTITLWQLRVYNLFTPIFRLLDGVLPLRGLSTVVVARKSNVVPLRAVA